MTLPCSTSPCHTQRQMPRGSPLFLQSGCAPYCRGDPNNSWEPHMPSGTPQWAIGINLHLQKGCNTNLLNRTHFIIVICVWLTFQLCMMALWSSLRAAYSLNAPNVPLGTLAPRSVSIIHLIRFGSHLLLAPFMQCPQSPRVSVDTFRVDLG